MYNQNQYPYYQMFNHDFIQRERQRQFYEQQFHKQQIKEIEDAAQGLRDFFEGVPKIAPEYQGHAATVFVGIALEYFIKYSKQL